MSRRKNRETDLCDDCLKTEKLNQIRDNHYPRIQKFCSEHGYTLMTQREEIFNNQSKIKYICPAHGEQATKVTSILQNKICYKCSRKNAGVNKWKHGKAERESALYDKVLAECSKAGYTLLDTDPSGFKYGQFFNYICPSHGKHRMNINNFLSGKRCPDCANEKLSEKYRKTPEQVEEEVLELGGHIYNPSDYVNQYEKNLSISCPECGQTFKTSLILFTQHGGQCCPECSKNESNGARRVRKYLEANGIEYDPEHWFRDCRDIKPLPFDFYLIGRNTIIEYDGAQHFKDSADPKFQESFEKTRAHDKIKNKYCKDNNIKLIRIPYWDFNRIEEILEEEIT